MAQSGTISAPARAPLARRLFAVSGFPLVFGGSLLAAFVAMDRGVDPGRAAGLPVLVAGTLVMILERFFPHHDSWKRSHGDIHVDLAFAPTVAITNAAVQAGLIVVLTPLAAGLSERVGLALWPHHWPLGIQLVVALVAAELPKYWVHRLQHEVDFLWRFHATHHSVPRLYFLNATRFHPVDIGLDTIAGGIVLVGLGVGAEVIALFTLVSAVHGFFQHANLELRLGPLNYFFSMAELHRWHHSRTVFEANHNYGQNVIVWDLVFGSFFWPKDREPPEDIGLAELEAFPMGYFGQLLSPLRWRAIREQSASR